MAEFILRRILQAILVLFVMTLLVFFGVNVIGNPVYIFASSECNQACLNAIIADLGLDRPIWQQYLLFLRTSSRATSAAPSPTASRP
jgi:peptide/nickel transport system permease protein